MTTADERKAQVEDILKDLYGFFNSMAKFPTTRTEDPAEPIVAGEYGLYVVAISADGLAGLGAISLRKQDEPLASLPDFIANHAKAMADAFADPDPQVGKVYPGAGEKQQDKE
jgi:hypothetical protein